MSWLSRQIRSLVSDGRYVIGEHASERLIERSIMEWQVVAGITDARDVEEQPTADPNPKATFCVLLPDGIEVKAIWSYLQQSEVAKLVTVHYFDRD